ncbi:helix-turn-helix domain-containing protein [Bradyrhizobium sediminis]|uniref:Helix-turn-helix domain-containing protein n=1 Tax=Bradyrhizobium sediminis TaxID=2840469 RepID=A0A975NHW2_9BRAD|nr:helix-turn-helix domain-containing protein [Bradyrhizobium sediminis]QWG15125.1 helix-turn-helix domain-containing protein [Bradyrhizobium sediminis]
MDRTTPNHRNGTFLAPLVTFTVLLGGVGTGGDYTPAYHALRESRDVFSKQRDSAPKSNGFAVSADIEYTKSTLHLSMAELARCLGVSRQALYNWIDGGSIKHENLAKLIELKSAAIVIADASLSERALFIHRKLPGGKTLIETVAMGGSGTEAAQSLVKLANEEAEQRLALNGLLVDRKPHNLLGHGTPELVDKS